MLVCRLKYPVAGLGTRSYIWVEWGNSSKCSFPGKTYAEQLDRTKNLPLRISPFYLTKSLKLLQVQVITASETLLPVPNFPPKVFSILL